MKQDISNRADIQRLIDSFYDKVRQDGVIGYLFTDVAKVDWPKHLPRMYDFWETVLFHTASFKGNPIPKHIALHQQSPLAKAHFDRWVGLFTQTVDELFEGDKAELAKQRAMSVATVMQLKVFNIDNPTSLL
jgi:hemoglobin